MKKKERIMYNIICNTDQNYLQHCCVMLCSLFENNRDIKIAVHVLANALNDSGVRYLKELGEKYGNSIHICSIDESKLEGVQFRKQRPLTKAAYYRILLPEVLDKAIERVLYLDCDIVVLGDIKELYDMDIDGYALAACRDVIPYTEEHRMQLGFDMSDISFCSGVMLINVKYWRECNAQEMLIKFAKKQRKNVYLHDQDALNSIFKHKWLLLPYKWNKTPRSIVPLDTMQKKFDIYNYVYEPKVIHYASALKPWMDVWFPERKYYRKYLKISCYEPMLIKHVAIRDRMREYLFNMRFLLNRYVRPFVPNVLELIVGDILNAIRIIYTLVFNLPQSKYLIISLWLKKQQ